MLQQRPLGDQILNVVRAHPDCTLDELILNLSRASWVEVLLEVDRMSQSGQLRLTKRNPGLMTTLRAA